MPDLSVTDLRRAVLGHFIRSAGPVAIADLVTALTPDFGESATPKRISDLVRYQVRLGRLARVRRGLYRYVPGSLPRTTAWRCVNWGRERGRTRLRPDVPYAPAFHVVPNVGGQRATDAH